VIDEAGEVGVLEVNADRKDVTAAVAVTDDATGQVRPVAGCVRL
jgi:hypothetical protein